MLGASMVELESKIVNLLLRQEVPETNRVTEPGIGEHQAPYAVNSAIGWVICGPPGKIILPTTSMRR